MPTSLGELRTALPSVYQVSSNGSRTEIDASFELTDQNTFGITLPNGYNPDHSLRIDPLIYSTFFGGSGDDCWIKPSKDEDNNFTCSGFSLSNNFPVVGGVYQPISRGMYDIIVTKFNHTFSQILYSTYLGGRNDEYSFGGVCDSIGGFLLAGWTYSPDFPTTTNSYQRTNRGQSDGFVAHLNNTGSVLLWSTYLGGSSEEIVWDIKKVSDESIVVTGRTDSQNFPTTPGCFDSQIGSDSSFDCFVTRVSNNGTQLLFSTFLGGSSFEAGNCLNVEHNDDIVVTGITGSSDFPTTTGVYDTSYNSGDGDCFLTRLNSSGTQLVFSTYLGGSGHDNGNTTIIDPIGGYVVTGWTASTDFPMTPNAYDSTFNGIEFDLFITRINSAGSSISYSTYLGGSGYESLVNISFDRFGNFVFSGATDPVFPTTPNAFQPVYNGGIDDGYISILSCTNSQMLYSSYFGGSLTDEIWYSQFDSNGELIVIGNTMSSDFPVTATAYDTSHNGSWDCFYARLLVQYDSSPEYDSQQIPEKFELYPN
ncbi:MAG: hypothetical protein OEM52_15185, partial [bacterium]|nr:hypothetical protein [bacterium]